MNTDKRAQIYKIGMMLMFAMMLFMWLLWRKDGLVLLTAALIVTAAPYLCERPPLVDLLRRFGETVPTNIPFFVLQIVPILAVSYVLIGLLDTLIVVAGGILATLSILLWNHLENTQTRYIDKNNT